MSVKGLSRRQCILKRILDLFVAVVGLVALSPLLLAGWIAAAVSSGASGVFRQERVGKDGEVFEVLKLRTMKEGGGTSTVTTRGDARVTRTGVLLRRFKIDELPQLLNVVRGEMSIVGPRPDVRGYADALVGEDRIILSVRPGITCPATLAYRHEEELLAVVPDPELHNREAIWPDKVRMNRAYVENYSLRGDLACIAATVASIWSRDDVREGVQCPSDF